MGGVGDAGVRGVGDESDKEEENDGEGHGGDCPVLPGPLSPPNKAAAESEVRRRPRHRSQRDG